MNKDVFTTVMEDHKELSSLPQVVAEIIKVSRNPNSSTKDLSKAIMKDPALTTRMLRVVNSPYYSPVQPITTISQAVMTLGNRPIVAMALAASVYNMVSNINSSIDRKKFWRHSLEAALAAQSIAKAVNYESPEEAFVAGLLHDIGILVLESSFKETFARIWKQVDTGEKLVDLEEEHWGTSHARVGQFIMRQWGLPEILCDAVGGHHTVFGVEDSHPYQKIILIINLANRITKFKIGNVPPPEAQVIELKKIMINNIDLDEDALADIERNLISEVVAESGFLEIEVGQPEEILGQANRMLYEQYITVEKLLLEKMRLERGEEAYEQMFDPMIFNQYLETIAEGMRRKSIILKKAIDAGDVKDKKGCVSGVINDVSNYAENVIMITNAQQKASQLNDYVTSKSFMEFRKRMDMFLKSEDDECRKQEPASV